MPFPHLHGLQEMPLDNVCLESSPRLVVAVLDCFDPGRFGWEAAGGVIVPHNCKLDFEFVDIV